VESRLSSIPRFDPSSRISQPYAQCCDCHVHDQGHACQRGPTSHWMLRSLNRPAAFPSGRGWPRQGSPRQFRVTSGQPEPRQTLMVETSGFWQKRLVNPIATRPVSGRVRSVMTWIRKASPSVDHKVSMRSLRLSIHPRLQTPIGSSAGGGGQGTPRWTEG
jgi:hypothetical protein